MGTDCGFQRGDDGEPWPVRVFFGFLAAESGGRGTIVLVSSPAAVQGFGQAGSVGVFPVGGEPRVLDDSVDGLDGQIRQRLQLGAGFGGRFRRLRVGLDSFVRQPVGERQDCGIACAFVVDGGERFAAPTKGRNRQGRWPPLW